jgi:hypothetical protein
MPDRARPDETGCDRPDRPDRPALPDRPLRPDPIPDRSSRPNILASLQIDTPIEEFRRHCEKKQRSFEGAAEGRASEIYRRAFELAESLIRRQGGGDGRC